jgi:hypothetical protein
VFSTLLFKDFIGIWFKIKIKTILLILHISLSSLLRVIENTDLCCQSLLLFFIIDYKWWLSLFRNPSTPPVLLLWTWFFFFLPPASSHEFNFNVIIFAILFLLQSISLYGLVDIFCTSAMRSSYIFVSSSQGHASHFPKFGRYCMRWGFLPPATKLCENAWKKLYIQVAPSIFSPCKS